MIYFCLDNPLHVQSAGAECLPIKLIGSLFALQTVQ